MDFSQLLKSAFPNLFSSPEFSTEAATILHSFITKIANSMTNSLSDIILNFPTITLQLLVVFFALFYALRDQKMILTYIKSLLPFSKDVENKLFEYSKSITASVLYGQVVIGAIQGIIAGLGFFIFRVPNPLFLMLLAIIVGVLPIVGTAIIWIPVAVYLFIAGNALPAWGVIVFGLISSTVEHFLRPLIVSRRTKMHSAVVLISMIGGVFFFGILGFILGPLILSYLLILLEIYRGKPTPGVIIEEPKK